MFWFIKVKSIALELNQQMSHEPH